MHGKITDLDRVQLFPKAFAQALTYILRDPVGFRIFFFYILFISSFSVSPVETRATIYLIWFIIRL